MADKQKENIIRWAEGSDEAEVYLTNRKLQNKLIRLGYDPDDDEKDSKGGLEFTIDVDMITIRKLREGGREWTDEERAAARERFMKATGRAGKATNGKKKAGAASKTEPVARKRREEEPEDEEEPRPSRRARRDRDEEPEEDERPRARTTRRSRDEEPEEEAPRKRRARDEEEEDVEIVRRRPAASRR